MIKLIRIILAVVVGLVVIVFAVVNRHLVEVSFAPFPVNVDLPLFVVALIAVFLGVLAGGTAAWIGAARTRAESRRLRRRADALEAQVAALQKQLAEAENRRAAAAAADGPPAPVVHPGRETQRALVGNGRA